ncbi:hypothetical protein B005_2086 [Nocardiopsis alba ATCC BAA-2165]|uniref:Uncharacterized protein n=1 Tax=Nocardiopsis alba (strain ATCC BAA-2165 / BE74) TaxID=1205910 RepID=J7L2U7_NOCAA|nr:hypothetical protein B005_2086 [Nocardiopsis alba ATCC BAA-2165]
MASIPCIGFRRIVDNRRCYGNIRERRCPEDARRAVLTPQAVPSGRPVD